jgi:hypothetical protein
MDEDVVWLLAIIAVAWWWFKQKKGIPAVRGSAAGARAQGRTVGPGMMQSSGVLSRSSSGGLASNTSPTTPVWRNGAYGRTQVGSGMRTVPSYAVAPSSTQGPGGAGINLNRGGRR